MYGQVLQVQVGIVIFVESDLVPFIERCFSMFSVKKIVAALIVYFKI